MNATLALDVYGTLIDTHGVVASLEEMIGARARGLSETWREKQLEYSFRRGLMQNYADFSVCTRHALEYACIRHEVELSEQQERDLLAMYRMLPAFEDVEEGLSLLKSAGHRLYAFSNGSAETVDSLLTAAGIRDYFLGIVSTEDLKSFKPNPAVYSYFLRRAGASGSEAWLISGNPFDVIGGVSAGMRGAWVRRTEGSIFDPWGIEPDLVVKDLKELHGRIG